MFDLDRLHQHIQGHLADQLRPLTWKKLRQGPNIVEVTICKDVWDKATATQILDLNMSSLGVIS